MRYLLSVAAAAPPKHSPSVFGILPTENELFTLFLLHYTTGPFENPTRKVSVASYVNAHLWVCITEYTKTALSSIIDCTNIKLCLKT